MDPQRPFAATSDAEREHVERQRERFEGWARSGFERFGRGVVLVTLFPPHAPEKAGTIEYVADHDVETVWPGRGWPEATTARAVAEYDPLGSFLVLFLDYQARTCRLHRFELAAS